MEVKKGDNTTKIPGLAIITGIVTVGVIVDSICRTVEKRRKQFRRRGDLDYGVSSLFYCQVRNGGNNV